MRTLAIAEGVSWRMLHNFFHNKSLLIPSVIFPLFFFAAFAGGLSGISHAPGFDFPAGYTAFQFAFVMLQSAAFAGVFTGFSIARDFESGFARRLLLSASHRTGIVLGYVIGALVRWFTTASLITVVAFAVQMNVGGSGVDLPGLYLLGIVVNITATLWAAGVAMRLRSMQAGPMMQVPGLPDPLLRPGVRAVGAAAGLDPWSRGRQPDDAHPRDGPKLRRGRAVGGRRGLPGGLRARRPVLRLGDPRPSQSRSSRITSPRGRQRHGGRTCPPGGARRCALARDRSRLRPADGACAAAVPDRAAPGGADRARRGGARDRLLHVPADQRRLPHGRARAGEMVRRRHRGEVDQVRPGVPGSRRRRGDASG